jgi:hypothetical protein
MKLPGNAPGEVQPAEGVVSGMVASPVGIPSV